MIFFLPFIRFFLFSIFYFYFIYSNPFVFKPLYFGFNINNTIYIYMSNIDPLSSRNSDIIPNPSLKSSPKHSPSSPLSLANSLNMSACSKRQRALSELEREERISRALLRVEQGLSYRQAAKEIGVSFGTIYGRFRGRKSRVKAQEARMKLSFLEETIIEKMLLTAVYLGKPYTQPYFVQAANNFLQAQGDPDPEKVTRQWYRHFRRRHPSMDSRELSVLHNPTQTQYLSETMDSWFKKFTDLCKTNNISQTNIYCIDEFGYVPGTAFTSNTSLQNRDTNYQLNSFKSRAATTQRLVDADDHVTILPPPPDTFTYVETISADNCLLPPYVVSQTSCTLYPASLSSSDPPDQTPDAFNYRAFRFTVSDTGWLSSHLILDWIQNHFDPLTRVKANGGYRLILLETSAVHFSSEFLQYGVKNKIIFLFFPPLDFKLSPLSHEALNPLKSDIYKVPLQSDIITSSSLPFKPALKNFLDVINATRQSVFSSETISTLWESSGLFAHDSLAFLQCQQDSGNETLRSASPTSTPNSSRLYVTYLPIKDLDIDISRIADQTRSTKLINKPAFPSTLHSNPKSNSHFSNRFSGNSRLGQSQSSLPLSSSVSVKDCTYSLSNNNILTTDSSTAGPSAKGHLVDPVLSTPLKNNNQLSFAFGKPSSFSSTFDFSNNPSSPKSSLLSAAYPLPVTDSPSFSKTLVSSDSNSLAIDGIFSDVLNLMSDPSNRKDPLTVFELAAESAAKNKLFNEQQLHHQKQIISMLMGMKSTLDNLTIRINALETDDNTQRPPSLKKHKSNSTDNIKNKQDCISIISNLQNDLTNMIIYPQVDIEQLKAASKANERIEMYLREEVHKASVGGVKSQFSPRPMILPAYPNTISGYGTLEQYHGPPPSNGNNHEFSSTASQKTKRKQDSMVLDNKPNHNRSFSSSSMATHNHDSTSSSPSYVPASSLVDPRKSQHMLASYSMDDNRRNPMSITTINNSPLPPPFSDGLYTSSSPSSHSSLPNVQHPGFSMTRRQSPTDSRSMRNSSTASSPAFVNSLPPLVSATTKTNSAPSSSSPTTSSPYLSSTSSTIGTPSNPISSSTPSQSVLPPLYGSSYPLDISSSSNGDGVQIPNPLNKTSG